MKAALTELLPGDAPGADSEQPASGPALEIRKLRPAGSAPHGLPRDPQNCLRTDPGAAFQGGAVAALPRLVEIGRAAGRRLCELRIRNKLVRRGDRFMLQPGADPP